MITAKNCYGTYFIPDGTDYTYTASAILAGKVHEPDTIQFILDHHNNKEIIHAGAGFGDFLPAFINIKRVWTFEPNPDNFRACLSTIETNNLHNVNLSDLALSSSKDVLSLLIQKDGVKLGVRSEIGFGGINVYASSLDDEIPSDVEISIIHLDLEGYEFQALKGAHRIISRDHPLIILEIDERATKYNEFMQKLNYYPFKHLIYDSGPMVFVNTVYKFNQECSSE